MKFPAAKIVALEPQADNFSLLRENISHLPQVIPLQAALTKEECKITMTTAEGFDERSYWAFQSKVAERDANAVAGHSLQTIAKKLNIDHWDILKIDIDLSLPQMTFIELHDHIISGSSDSFMRSMLTVEGNAWVEEENVVIMSDRSKAS